MSGMYNQYGFVRRSWLLGNKSKRWVNCDGCIEFRLPQKSWRDATKTAESIWQIAAHEFGHAKDDQEGKMGELRMEDNSGGSKRKAHDKRAIERSVYDQFYDKGVEDPHTSFSKQITLPKKAQEAILNLAEWYDGLWTIKIGDGATIPVYNVQISAASPKIKGDNDA